MSYGKELILDLHDCDTNYFNRVSIKQFMWRICKIIDMKRCELHFWDDAELPENEKQTSSQTKGTSAVQFILTSNITIHTLDLLGNVYLNIFSCKDFDTDRAASFAAKHFHGKIVHRVSLERM